MTTIPILDRTQRSELAKQARREEILDAARRVFSARGFRGTTIADIADEARIALGTIYLYFQSKEDVFAALNQRLAEIIAAAMNGVPRGGSMIETTQRRVASVFDACSANRDLVRLVVLNTDPESAATRRMREGDEDRARPLIAAIDASVRRGLVRAGDPVIMTKLIQGVVSFAVYQAFVLSDGNGAEQYRDACADMIVAYLRPEVTA